MHNAGAGLEGVHSIQGTGLEGCTIQGTGLEGCTCNTGGWVRRGPQYKGAGLEGVHNTGGWVRGSPQYRGLG